MDTFISKVKQFICANDLFDTERLQLIALSGGADSVALLRVMLQLGYKCHAVHCNFHLRGEESMRDEQFVRELCNTLSVPLYVQDFDTVSYAESNGISIEMAARELRYSLFEELREKNNAERIVVAHHLNDSVETVIMNLARGTGLRGLRGIMPLNGGIARPLLNVSRDEIEQYLEESGQAFVVDSTNLQTEYRRNKIRHNVIPVLKELNPNVEKSIMQASTRLQQAYTLYNKSVLQAIDRILTTDGVTARIDIAALHKEDAHETIAFELLNRFGFQEPQVQDILSIPAGTSGKQFNSASHALVIDRDSLLIRPLMPQGAFTSEIVLDTDVKRVTLPFGKALVFSKVSQGTAISHDSQIAMIDADLAGNRFIIRQVTEGDSFIPFGMKGKQNLSDFMTNRKFSLFQKQDQLVVCNDSGIVWVIGQRIDNRYRITERTKNILKINYDNEE